MVPKRPSNVCYALLIQQVGAEALASYCTMGPVRFLGVASIFQNRDRLSSSPVGLAVQGVLGPLDRRKAKLVHADLILKGQVP